MVYFPSAIFSGFSQGTAALSLASMAQLTADAVRDFFINLFLHPGENVTALMILCGVTIAAVAGIAFLAKLAYEKSCPEKI